ncbi:MAG: hypothetical protein LBE38_12200 [Deltaproteobacteria bacterium]|jgi:hypothetical protein|nr:hypothetical protein [Deltaproteobacteria bacterium]
MDTSVQVAAEILSFTFVQVAAEILSFTFVQVAAEILSFTLKKAPGLYLELANFGFGGV